MEFKQLLLTIKVQWKLHILSFVIIRNFVTKNISVWYDSYKSC